MQQYRQMKKFLNVRCFSAAGLVAFLLGYSLLYNFSFLPLTEGWFSSYAHLVIDGKVPYRDFYLYLTPLYVWVISLITYIFGESLFALRVFGVLITCSIGLLLFKIFRFKFSPAASFVGATIATLYYQSGNAYISYDFTQVLTLFTLLSFNFLLTAEQAVRWLDRVEDGLKSNVSKASISLFFAGFFASCAFLTKQSNGSFIAVFAFLSCLYITLISNIGFHRKIRLLLYFLCGGFLPIGLIIAYLALNQALVPFVDQIFFNAISAKGSLTKILSSWITGVFSSVLKIKVYEIARVFISFFVFGKLMFWVLNCSRYLADIYKKMEKYRQTSVLTAFLLLFTFVIICAWQDNTSLKNQFFQPGRHLLNYLIPLSIGWTLIQLALVPISFSIPKYVKIDKGTTILAICVLGQFFGNGTSAGLSEISSFIAIGWVASWLCNRGSIPFLGVWLAFYSCALLSTTLIYSKLDRPYAWWGVSEPSTRSARLHIDNPVLKGLYISPETEKTFSGAINVLRSEKTNSIFSFPNIPIFYLITNTWPKSKAIITWFDFLNDKDAIAESIRLKGDPPDTIIYLDLPEEAWSAHERLFREGKPLGQRDIQAWLDETCALEKGYQIQFKRALDDQTTLYICRKNYKE
jgi:hypothetical protein